MKNNSLFREKTGQKICEIEKHFGLPIVEFNETADLLINLVQSRHSEKATSWIWHLRLSHAEPEIIQQLKKIDEVEVIVGQAPKTVNCETCAVFKMHEIIKRAPTARAIKLFEVLHFDLTINNIGFDGSRCIAHFTDEFISFNWVYFLRNHKKETLLPIFKALINQCDQTGLAINAVVSAIHTGQETSIENKLQDWLLQQGIKWDWSAKNIFSQNEKSERFDALLTEKVRCIRLHAKFFEKLYSECYLAAAYLMNRTSMKRLNWKSLLVAV